MEKPICNLAGEDGNVFHVIGMVGRTLKNAGRLDLCRDFTQAAFESGSYDKVLQLVMQYVEIE